VRTIRRALDRLPLYWEAGLRRLPFFTQRTAVLLLGVLVAALAMVGGVVALVGWPGANGPAHLVPGERAGLAPESRPEPGDRPAPGSSGAGARSGANAGGATAASPSPADQPGDATTAASPPGSAAAGVSGSGAGGPPAAPPTTSPPATAPQGPLDPVDELLGPVVSTLLP
jgi:predicted lipid-binding transport protein (Tim44 family)